MTSTTSLCPTSIVQPFDQKYGSREWIPRRRFIQIITRLPLSTIKAKGAHAKRREGLSDGCRPTRKHEYQLSATRCFVAAAAESDVALQEPIAEAGASVETQTENLEVRDVGLEAARGKDLEKREQNLKQNPSRRLVEDKDVVAGSVFTGKVRSILSFGAFVDFGAFTDGLVHISQLSNAFVRSVEDVVSVGQEVQVKILDVNFTSKRIALSMKEPEGGQENRANGEGRMRRAAGQAQGGGEGNSAGRGKTAGSVRSRKVDEKKKSNFQKGQQLDGVVKNLIRRGAFVTLPGGEEGFLPATEIPGGDRTPLERLVPAGKEVSVRVVKVGAGKVGLSLKPVLDLASLNKVLNQDVEIGGGNAFEIAFRSNPAIGKYLTDLESRNIQPAVDETTASEDDALGEDPSIRSEDEKVEEALVSASDDPTADNLYKEESSVIVEDKLDKTEVIDEAAMDGEQELMSAAEKISIAVAAEAVENVEYVAPLAENVAAASTVEAVAINDRTDEFRGEVDADGEGNMETENEVFSVAEETAIATEDRTLHLTVNITSNAEVDEAKESTDEESWEIVEKADSDEIIDQTSEEAVMHSVAILETTEGTESHTSDTAAVESTPNRILAFHEAVESKLPMPPEGIEQLPSLSMGNKEKATLSTVPAPILTSAAEASLEVKSTKISEGSGAITSSLIRKLREETGVGMMDCKKALIETGGNLEEARNYLRKKGLASAEKKVSRIATEGLIGSYIHDSRIGVLIEVNCETDFVSRGEIFRKIVEDLAMQVVASQQVQYVSIDDVPLEVKNKEIEIELQREDLQHKPEQIRAKIVDGRVSKRLGELALLEQPFIKDDTILVKDLVNQTIASIGENIRVRRFTRFTLGEGLEKKVQHFATDVAAQTKSAEVAGPVGGESAVNAASPSAPVNVNAAAVKQLREESGAGMMDCKKALVASSGDFEGAREYLRKKGLASADKKAGRIAAEGAIGSYIHDSRIGVLLEVNCETDFVSRGEIFKQLMEDLAMQVAANQQVHYVSVDDIPFELQARERELEMQREDLQKKPEQFRAKIVEGRLAKRFGELALLEQPFIKNENLLVRDLVKQTVASLGENVRIRRFVRYILGEGLEKRNEDFAAEVAAQTRGKEAASIVSK